MCVFNYVFNYINIGLNMLTADFHTDSLCSIKKELTRSGIYLQKIH